MKFFKVFILIMVSFASANLDLRFSNNKIFIDIDVSHDLVTRDTLVNGNKLKYFDASGFSMTGKYPNAFHLEKRIYLQLPSRTTIDYETIINSQQEIGFNLLSVPQIKYDNMEMGNAVPVYNKKARLETKEPLDLVHIKDNLFCLTYYPLINFQGKNKLVTKVSLVAKMGTKIEDFYTKISLSNNMDNIIKTPINSYDIKSNRDVQCFWDQKGTWIKLSNDKTGMLKVTAKQLKDLGVDLTAVLSSNLKIFKSVGPDLPHEIVSYSVDSIFHGAKEISRRIIDFNKDGYFNNNDEIIFFTEGILSWDRNKDHVYRSLFSNQNYYWIYLNRKGDSKGLNMKYFPKENFISKIESYRNAFYDGNHDKLNQTIFHKYNWVWSSFAIPKQGSWTKKIEVPSFIRNKGVFLRSVSDRRINYLNSLKLYINGSSSALTIKEGNVETSLPDSVLVSNGPNQFRFTTNYTNHYLHYLSLLYWVDKMSFGKLNMTTVPDSGNYQILTAKNTDYVYQINNDQQVIYAPVKDKMTTLPMKKGDNWLFTSNYHDPISMEIIHNNQPSLHKRNGRTEMIIISPIQFYNYIKEDKSGFIKAHLNEYQADLPEEMRIKNIDVILISDIVREFGRGYQEPAALRNFIQFIHDKWDTRYVLLVGDGNHDFRNLKKYSEPNFIYPSSNDYRGTYFEGGDAYYGSIDKLSNVAIGRLPVSNIQDLKSSLSKIVNYIKDPNLSSGKLTLLGDDEHNMDTGSSSETRHIRGLEVYIAPKIASEINIHKIYLTEYDFKFINGKKVKPGAHKELVKTFNEGTNLCIYFGHGSDSRLSHEASYDQKSLSLLSNKNKYFTLFAATCDFGNIFCPDKKILLEQTVNAKNKGAVNIIASPIGTYSHENNPFFSAILDKMLDSNKKGVRARLGDAFLHGLNSHHNPSYILCGDPAIRIYRDQNILEEKDSITVYSGVLNEIKFSVSDSSSSNNEGQLNFVMNQSDRKISYPIASNNSVLEYILPGDKIFKAASSFKNKEGLLKFVMPTDLDVDQNPGKAFVYVADKSGRDIASSIKKVKFSKKDSNKKDTIPPEIIIKFNDKYYHEGDPISQDPLLIIEIRDESGINTMGNIGHKLILEMEGTKIDVSSEFIYDVDSYQKGQVEYQLFNLKEGKHNLKVEVWDNLNNYAEKEISFNVVNSSNKPSSDWVSNLISYPNPIRKKTKYTDFTFSCLHPLQIKDVKIQIYTINGRKVKTIFSNNITSDSFQKIKWNCRDEDGDIPANGAYFYTVRVNYGSKTIIKKGKLLFAR